ncbi:MAG: ArsA family ATPase [Candidatus Njordarchaeia archaeon]
MIDELSKKRWIFVSGKGGTGKTTTASSIAIQLAEMGLKTLIVSLDPAHSLSDSLVAEIGSEIVKIDNINGELYALEFDIKKAFKEEQDALAKLPQSPELSQFGLGDEYMDLISNTPQMPVEYFEGLGFLKLFKMTETSDFDIIVFDTAPTGHTLKLLELPEYLDSFIGKMLKFQLKFASIFNNIKRFFGFGGEDDQSKRLLEFLEEAQNTVKDIKQKITNEKETEFIVVGIPTMMSLLESIRLVTELTFYTIPNKYIVINMVRIYGGDQCVFSKKMAEMHYDILKEYEKEFPDKEIRVIPFFADEIRGVEKLKKVNQYLNNFTLRDAITALENNETIE